MLPKCKFRCCIGILLTFGSTLGVQIDGQIAVFGHTHVAGVRDEPLQGPGADAICAAHVAAEVVLRMLRPGVSVSRASSVPR